MLRYIHLKYVKAPPGSWDACKYCIFRANGHLYTCFLKTKCYDPRFPLKQPLGDEYIDRL